MCARVCVCMCVCSMVRDGDAFDVVIPSMFVLGKEGWRIARGIQEVPVAPLSGLAAIQNRIFCVSISNCKRVTRVTENAKSDIVQ